MFDILITLKRTGTLWEGRFKSCLVQDQSYLFHLYRYIELNPVRAGMVDDPADYSWSSYQCNGLGVDSKLLTPHERYLSLGRSIRLTVSKGLALGNEKFKEQIEALSGQRQSEGKRGRKKV